MRVEVKQKHIDQALALRAARMDRNHLMAQNANECPIALAVKEQTKIPGVASVIVSPDGVIVFMGAHLAASYTLSDHARRFIDAFDSWKSVTPNTFQLTPVK